MIVKERRINLILISRISVNNVEIKQGNVEIKRMDKSPKTLMRTRVIRSNDDKRNDCYSENGA